MVWIGVIYLGLLLCFRPRLLWFVFGSVLINYFVTILGNGC